MPFALALTVVLAALAVFQLALVFGAPLGRFAWGGAHRVLPARLRVGSAVSIVIYALIDVIAWDRVGAIDVFPEPFSEVAMWVIFGYFVLGILHERDLAQQTGAEPDGAGFDRSRCAVVPHRDGLRRARDGDLATRLGRRRHFLRGDDVGHGDAFDAALAVDDDGLGIRAQQLAERIRRLPGGQQIAHDHPMTGLRAVSP